MYKIIGLNKVNYIGNTYITNNFNDKILIENNKALSKDKIFTKYTIYLVDKDNIYYSIILYETNEASFYDNLCTIGHKEIYIIKDINSININYITKQDIYIKKEDFNNINDDDFELYDFELYGYYDEEYLKIYEESILKYSSIGGDEANPNGYIFVNTELFNMYVNTKII